MYGSISASTCAVGMLVAAAAVLLKNFGFKGACVFTAASIAIMLSSAISPIRSIFSSLGEAFSPELLPYGEAAVKVVGIGYLSGVSSDIAKELGEAGVAKAVLLVAKLELVLIAVPFIEEVMGIANELIAGG